jgi:flagellar biosynthesis/type III secretory pathway M-ring protein FliF/YscJ
MPFEEAVLVPELPSPSWYAELPVAQVMLGGVALVAFFVLRSMLSKSVVETAAPVEEPGVEGAQALTAEARAKERVKDEISRLSQQQPETVAMVLKSWLME